MQPPKNPIGSYKIVYQDGAGRVTERTIDIPDFPSAFGVWIEAYCRLRKGYRSFYPDRILKCVDTGNGKVVPNLIQHVRSLARDEPRTTTSNAESLAMASYLRELGGFVRGITADQVLYHTELLALRKLFARCPGDRPKEIDDVLDVLEAAQEDGVISSNEHEKIMRTVQRVGALY